VHYVEIQDSFNLDVVLIEYALVRRIKMIVELKEVEVDPIDIFILAAIKKIAEDNDYSYTKTRDTILQWEQMKDKQLPEFLEKLNK